METNDTLMSEDLTEGDNTSHDSYEDLVTQCQDDKSSTIDSQTLNQADQNSQLNKSLHKFFTHSKFCNSELQWMI